MLSTRRSFVKALTLSSAAVSIKANAALELLSPVRNGNQLDRSTFSVFSKNLQFLSIAEMAKVVAAMGFDGIDLTVRPNGHVLPANVTSDLPKAVDAIRKAGLEVYMITTAIANATEPFTEDIVRTAGNLGIKYYRMGWFSYNEALSRRDNIKTFNTTFRQLQELNEKYRMHGAYQNHAGKSFGSAVVDLAIAFEGIDAEWIGCQYDIRHATVEGANSWPIGYDLLQQHIKTINIKDFYWANKQGKWKEENVPLGKGMVDFNSYISRLKTDRFKGPVSLHYEYELGGAENGATKITIAPEVIYKHMRTDLQQLKNWLGEAGK